MNICMLADGRFCRFVCVTLAIVTATAPSMTVFAQGAVQAVRQRVQGLDRGPGGPPPDAPPPSETPQGEAPYTEQPASSQPSTVKIDTTFVAPSASAVVVLRPAQLMASPIGQLLPVEVASAAGQQYLGFDPAEVDEVIAFADLANMMAPSYGVAIKFKSPFRASALPSHIRPAVQLGELSGKKYLQSGHPVFPSFYGPNNKTLVCAPDATLRPLIEAAGQPKTGPLLDRVREAPAGSDLYVAIDVASLRPLIQLGLAQAQAKAPPDAKPFLEAPKLISAAELTLNITVAGPTSLVLQANDETAAQQLETMLQEARNKYQAMSQNAPAAVDSPVQQALMRYKERMSKPFQPVRNGASLTCFQTDGQDATQRQLMGVAVVGVLVAALLPAVQAAREAARRAQAGEGVSAPPEAPASSEAPVGRESQPRQGP